MTRWSVFSRKYRPGQTARVSRKKIFWSIIILATGAFLTWRMIRPMNIFVVTDAFAKPMAITVPPEGVESLNASSCGKCHTETYREWAGSMHASAWTDPYYQVDLIFDGNQQICINCHSPLQNQQENLVLGFRDKERFKPILKKNPDFDPELQKEGVTCVVCHLRSGVIIGPYSDTEAPHPTRFDPSMVDGIGVCRKCHVVSGNRWDTFFRIPPCGTVSEIREGQTTSIDCTGCHMPAVRRPLVEGWQDRQVRRHLWLGGHDKETVKNALQAELEIIKNKNTREATLTLTNTGADHFLPTGTPDRHLTVLFSLTGPAGKIIKEKSYLLKRTIMWRPFIVDLWDTRLVKNTPEKFIFRWKSGLSDDSMLSVTVRYHLLDEKQRKKIGYQNTSPISYPVFEQSIPPSN
ncbi:MAG TPA: hypothetical protein EYP35_09290 [Desulfobacterales bacterium]|nr:hypothetical protein [Desulfobacterales bacterium]